MGMRRITVGKYDDPNAGMYGDLGGLLGSLGGFALGNMIAPGIGGGVGASLGSGLGGALGGGGGGGGAPSGMMNKGIGGGLGSVIGGVAGSLLGGKAGGGSSKKQQIGVAPISTEFNPGFPGIGTGAIQFGGMGDQTTSGGAQTLMDLMGGLGTGLAVGDFLGGTGGDKSAIGQMNLMQMLANAFRRKNRANSPAGLAIGQTSGLGLPITNNMAGGIGDLAF